MRLFRYHVGVLGKAASVTPLLSLALPLISGVRRHRHSMTPISIGRIATANLDLFLLSLSSPADLDATISLASSHFGCFIAWNARAQSAMSILSVIELLMRSGASYFCCWGDDCERVHDIIDEIDAAPDEELASPFNAVRTTTWHDEESLGEAIEFFLTTTLAHEHYEPTTRSALVLIIGDNKFASEVRKTLLTKMADSGAA